MDLEEYWIREVKNSHIGDDGAVIDGKVYAMDAFFEDRHFKREWMSVEQVATKAFLVNLSDMVAMNADTKYMLLTLNIPNWLQEEELRRLARRLKELSKEYGVEIIGGDTIGSSKLGLTITMVGESKTPLMRKGVKDGDLLAYTGDLGVVKRDLDRLFRGEKIESSSKFYTPILRVDFIREATPFLSGGMDISDGLYCDTNKLLMENSLYFEELKEIPVEVGESGEEYEMLIAFNPKNLETIKEIAKKTDTPITIFAKATDRKSEPYPCKSHHF